MSGTNVTAGHVRLGNLIQSVRRLPSPVARVDQTVVTVWVSHRRVEGHRPPSSSMGQLVNWAVGPGHLTVAIVVAVDLVSPVVVGPCCPGEATGVLCVSLPETFVGLEISMRRSPTGADDWWCPVVMRPTGRVEDWLSLVASLCVHLPSGMAIYQTPLQGDGGGELLLL